MNYEDADCWLVEPARGEDSRANWWGADSCEYVTVVNVGLIYEEEDEEDFGESVIGGTRSCTDNYDPVGSYPFDN